MSHASPKRVLARLRCHTIDTFPPKEQGSWPGPGTAGNDLRVRVLSPQAPTLVTLPPRAFSDSRERSLCQSVLGPQTNPGLTQRGLTTCATMNSEY